MALIPISDQLLVRPNPAETRIGSVLLPDRIHHLPRQGRVLAVGPGRRTEAGALVPMQVKPGDEIMYSWDHTEHEFDGEKVVLVSEQKVIARVLPEL